MHSHAEIIRVRYEWHLLKRKLLKTNRKGRVNDKLIATKQIAIIESPNKWGLSESQIASRRSPLEVTQQIAPENVLERV